MFKKFILISILICLSKSEETCSAYDTKDTDGTGCYSISVKDGLCCRILVLNEDDTENKPFCYEVSSSTISSTSDEDTNYKALSKIVEDIYKKDYQDKYGIEIYCKKNDNDDEYNGAFYPKNSCYNVEDYASKDNCTKAISIENKKCCFLKGSIKENGKKQDVKACTILEEKEYKDINAYIKNIEKEEKDVKINSIDCESNFLKITTSLIIALLTFFF